MPCGTLAWGVKSRKPGQRRGVPFLVSLTMVIAGACGDSESKPSQPQLLSASDQRVVAQARASLYSYCRKVGLYLTRRDPPPTAAEAEQVASELDRLIALARENPEARLRSQVTMRQMLGDMLEDLEGSSCSGAFEQKLGQGRATLPPPQDP